MSIGVSLASMGFKGGGGTPVSPAGWGLVALVPGDGQMVVNVVAAALTDIVFVRYRQFLSTGAWSPESLALSRVGSGPITIPELANEQYREFIVYAKRTVTGSCSYWSEPRFGAASDGQVAVIDQIMEAVAGEINALGLTSLDEASASVAVAATVDIPPLFDDVNTPCVKVFPDTEEAETGRRNLVTYRVNVALCQRSKTIPQQEEQFGLREAIRDRFLGRRLVVMPGVVCTGEAESGVLDMSTLMDRFQWVSVITFEFSVLKAKG